MPATIPMPPEAPVTAPEILGYTPMGRYVTICSIYPLPVESDIMPHMSVSVVDGQPRRGSIRRYKMEAGSVDKPAYLRVYDTHSLVQNTQRMNGDDPEMLPQPIAAGDIAANLIQAWGGNQLNAHAGAAGIFICKGDTATPDELAAAQSRQTARFRFDISAADELWLNPNRRNGTLYVEARRAAEWLGVKDVKAHPWLGTLEYKEAKKCPACGTDVDITVHVCLGCRENIAKYMLDRGMEVNNWPGVEREMEFLKRAKAEVVASAPAAAKPTLGVK